MVNPLPTVGFLLLAVAAVPLLYGMWLDFRTKLPDIAKILSAERLQADPKGTLVEFDREHLIWLRATLRQFRYWMASNLLMIAATVCLAAGLSTHWYLRVLWAVIAVLRIAMLPRDRQRLAYWHRRIAETEDAIVARLRPAEEAERILRGDT